VCVINAYKYATHNIRKFWSSNVHTHSANLTLFVTFYDFLIRHFKKKRKSHVYLKSEKKNVKYVYILEHWQRYSCWRMCSICRWLSSNVSMSCRNNCCWLFSRSTSVWFSWSICLWLSSIIWCCSNSCCLSVLVADWPSTLWEDSSSNNNQPVAMVICDAQTLQCIDYEKRLNEVLIIIRSINQS